MRASAALAGSLAGVGAGRVAVAPAVGQHGTVTVTRDLGLDQRYQGSVEVASGEVDVDLEHYLNASEQLPSVLACEVILDREGKVLRAAGLLCQTFPDGDTAELEQLRGVLAAGNLADLLRHDRSCREIIGFSLGGEAFDDMGASPLYFRCGCGPERARQIVSTLGAADIEALADEQPQTEVRCEYCGAVYALDSAALRALAAEIRRGRS
nr:Hsp33 family molecular chaperone HslO [Nannocystis sp.]